MLLAFGPGPGSAFILHSFPLKQMENPRIEPENKSKLLAP